MNGHESVCAEAPLQRCPKCGDGCSSWVRLLPYKHQVSGHHRVMLLDDETICKPLMKKEYAFYKSTPANIARFVPKLKGIANASSKTVENGCDDLYANPIINNDLKIKSPFNCSIQRSISNGSSIGFHCKWKYTPGQDWNNEEKVFDEHPWVQKVQQMSFEKNMYKTDDSKLILLEHIGHGYKFPCIMDLKMGVQQHGDDATDIKIRDHKERCEKSTSGSLGVRLCGMQVYDPDTNTYIYTDKYTGRKLATDGFRDCLFSFLNRGKRLDVIQPINDLLDDLYKGINSLNNCRFFCSSLLLLYDADLNSGLKVEIRMIDFANVTLFNKKHDGPDHGYLFGLTNLRKLFEDIKCKLKSGV